MLKEIKEKFHLILGLSLLCFIEGGFVEKVGSSFEAGIHGWQLPINGLVMFGFFFYLGYMAGRER